MEFCFFYAIAAYWALSTSYLIWLVPNPHSKLKLVIFAVLFGPIVFPLAFMSHLYHLLMQNSSDDIVLDRYTISAKGTRRGDK